MPRVLLADLSIRLEDIQESSPRRQPTIEGQEARCPRCDRIMIVRMGRRTPEYHCACEARQSARHDSEAGG
jgi:hypothetical protein